MTAKCHHQTVISTGHAGHFSSEFRHHDERRSCGNYRNRPASLTYREIDGPVTLNAERNATA
jgi:hypothetical protein